MTEATNDESSKRGRGRRATAPEDDPCGGPGSPGAGRYRRSVLEVAILSSLADSDAHGYDLLERIESLVGDLVCVDSGTMYRMLRAMEQDGLVTSSWQLAEAGPSRRVYVLTDGGVDSLESMAGSLSARAAAMQELAAKAGRLIERVRRPAQ